MDLRERTKPRSPWRASLHEVIFEADTPFGKAFDLLLIVCILASVVAVMLESVAPVRQQYGRYLYAAEWVFTVVFTVEYLLRLICIGRPLKYATSFFGIVDLLAVIPTYLDLLVPGSRFLLVIRILRLLRIFRVLKLVHYVRDADLLLQAIRASRQKVIVFLFAVATIAVIMGSLMYVIEGEKHGFTSIPVSVYWAIVTMTTVGYGDLSPATGLGQTVAAVLMIMGYSIIAVPTGIVSAEMARTRFPKVTTQSCPECSAEGHDADATHCKHCGASLTPKTP
jgi:voltage-gated potassium channel